MQQMAPAAISITHLKQMSHHYSGPDWGFPRGDSRLDLTDLYAFPKPGDAGKLDNPNTHKPKPLAQEPSQRASALYAHPHFLA